MNINSFTMSCSNKMLTIKTEPEDSGETEMLTMKTEEEDFDETVVALDTC